MDRLLAVAILEVYGGTLEGWIMQSVREGWKWVSRRGETVRCQYVSQIKNGGKRVQEEQCGWKIDT